MLRLVIPASFFRTQQLAPTINDCEKASFRLPALSFKELCEYSLIFDITPFSLEKHTIFAKLTIIRDMQRLASMHVETKVIVLSVLGDQ